MSPKPSSPAVVRLQSDCTLPETSFAGSCKIGSNKTLVFGRTLGIAFLMIATVIGTWAVNARSSNAQVVGDTVVVTAETTLKVRDQEVGKLFPGMILKVTHVNGKWMAVEGKKGWVNSTFVMNLDSALKSFDQRLQQNAGDIEAMAVRGLIFYHQGKLAESIGTYNQAIRMNPKLPQLWNNRALALIAQSRYDLAEKDLMNAIELSPDYAEAYANLGWVYFSVYDWEKAIEYYNKAVELNPEDPNNYVNRGSCYRKLGDLDKALADFDAALERTINLPAAFVGRSSVFVDLRKLDEAIESANKALKMDEDNVQALINRGWAKFQKNRDPESIKDLDKAIAYDEDALDAYINRSAIQLHLKNLKAARQDLEKAKSLSPEDPIVWINEGEVELAEGNFAASLKAFRKAVELAPEIAETQNGLAWVLATADDEAVRDADEALKRAQQACEMSKNQDWSHLDTLGAAYANQGDFDKAIQFANKALELVPDAFKEEVQQRLDGYQQKKPFRETGSH